MGIDWEFKRSLQSGTPNAKVTCIPQPSEVLPGLVLQLSIAIKIQEDLTHLRAIKG
jgi:hypothetical protein